MEYYHIPAERLGEGAKLPILKLGDSGEVFYELALEMFREIQRNNAAGRRTVFIVPVGPVGQYPIFVRLVNREKLSLKNCWFINMDEYLTDDGKWIDMGSKLSFRGFMDREVYGRIDPALVIPPEQRIFPDPERPGRVQEVIDRLGGVDVCFGGIGITGHLAFNEPQSGLSPEEFALLPTRVLDISPEQMRHRGHEGDPLRREAAPGRLPRLAPGRLPPGGLRRGVRLLPGHPGPEPPGRAALR